MVGLARKSTRRTARFGRAPGSEGADEAELILWHFS